MASFKHFGRMRGPNFWRATRPRVQTPILQCRYYINSTLQDAAMSANSCSSCCSNCRDGPQKLTNNAPAFALQNLLPVGVLNITVVVEDQATICTVLCGHSHAEDNWHAFNGSTLLSHLTSLEDDGFCRELDFLIKHDFIFVTCRLDKKQTLIVRVYLIPHDLPNVQGRLRLRKEAVLSTARRYLSILLPRIRCCQKGWDGYDQECQSCPLLLDTNKVSSS